jgi:hypothetical protein
MIHTIQPDTFLRHHRQRTDRIVQRYEHRRAAADRTPTGPRNNATVSA